MGPREATQQLVTDAADQVEWLDEYSANVTVEGRAIRVVLPLFAVAGHRGVRVSGIHILVPLAQRPIEFDLGARGKVHFSMPTERTGDATFDERFIIHGIPIAPIVSAFDHDIRRWLERYFPDWPSLTTRDGSLQLWHQTVFQFGGETSPAAVREAFQWAGHIADRLVTEFDRAHMEAGRTSGPAAADQWLEDVQNAHGRRGRKRTMIRIIVFGLLAALPILAVVLTFLLG